ARGRYPDFIKLFAQQTAARAAVARRNDRPEGNRRADAAAALLAAALRTPGCPPDVQLNRVITQHHLAQHLRPKAAVQAAIDRLAPTYALAAPRTVGPLLFAGHVHVDAAWRLHDAEEQDDDDENAVPVAPAKPANREAAMAEHLAAARAAFSAAWQLDPADGRAPAAMVTALTLAADDDRAEMDRWFDRAMAADADNLTAVDRKLKYLSTEWHGEEGEMLEFARRCGESGNHRGGVATAPARAHARLARESKVGDRYYDRPGVWDEVRATYAAHLAAVPDDASGRSAYARLAWRTGHCDVAAAQAALLGGGGDPVPFGGLAGYDRFRIAAAAAVRPPPAGTAAPIARSFAIPPPSDRMAAALAAAGEAGGPHEPAVAAAVRAVAAEFPELRVADGPGRAEWNRVTLNRTGAGFDCVRFRAPAAGPRDLRWARIYGPAGNASWYIMRVEDRPVDGFRDFCMPTEARYLTNARGPGDGGRHRAILQDLPAASLTPGAEYLLWFRFASAYPARVSIAVTFVPPADRKPDSRRILNDMGIKWLGDK
ncbi:MAG: hypothetical protein JWO31_1238, partial [Phycisphaerales bacterium]|nr:hypothetical protein [Phycisphaerales bacterium]